MMKNQEQNSSAMIKTDLKETRKSQIQYNITLKILLIVN